MRRGGLKTASLNPPCQLSPQLLGTAHEEQTPATSPGARIEPLAAAPPTRAVLARSRQSERRQ